MNYRFAFVIALRQPTISNFHPTGANNNNHAVGFSVVMLSLRVSHSDAIKGRMSLINVICLKSSYVGTVLKITTTTTYITAFQSASIVYNSSPML